MVLWNEYTSKVKNKAINSQSLNLESIYCQQQKQGKNWVPKGISSTCKFYNHLTYTASGTELINQGKAMNIPQLHLLTKVVLVHGCKLTRSRAAFSKAFLATANFCSRSVSCWACKMKERSIFPGNVILSPPL